jgi:hypothetical protein
MRLKPSRVRLYHQLLQSRKVVTYKKPEASQDTSVRELKASVILGMAVARISWSTSKYFHLVVYMRTYQEQRGRWKSSTR